MLNLFFFAVIFAAIHTGDLFTLIPISCIYMLLLNWLAETEINGSDYYTERPSSFDLDSSYGLADDTHSDLDNSTTR